jgi:hypothetical protein
MNLEEIINELKDCSNNAVLRVHHIFDEIYQNKGRIPLPLRQRDESL